MKKLNKILSIILAIMMLLFTITITSTANTGSDWLYSVMIGKTVQITGYKGSETEIEIPSSINGYTVTKIASGAFYDCYQLVSITIPDSVTTIGGCVFEGCSNLESITIGAGVTAIDGGAFYDCYPTSITVSNNNKYYSSDADGVLFNKDKTTLIHYPVGNKRTCYTIPGSVITIDSTSFYGCSNLTSVTIPNSVTTINSLAFGWCGLTSVTVPESVTTIGEGVFNNCYNLEKVRIYNGVTTIGKGMFSWCQSLVSVNIPISVTEIGDSAFNYCRELEDVYYEGTSEQWERLTRFLSIFICSYPTIHCNSTSADTHPYNPIITSPTCTEQGYITYTCDCGYSNGVIDYIDATNHYYTPEITIPATHLDEGLMTLTCVCGDTYTETIEKIAEHNYEATVTSPTCTEQGYTTYTCECGDGYVNDYVDALGHADNDGDGYCDADNELLDPSVECEHMCHTDGIMGIIWKIVNIIYMLLGSNQTCSCGVAHY